MKLTKAQEALLIQIGLKTLLDKALNGHAVPHTLRSVAAKKVAKKVKTRKGWSPAQRRNFMQTMAAKKNAPPTVTLNDE